MVMGTAVPPRNASWQADGRDSALRNRALGRLVPTCEWCNSYRRVIRPNPALTGPQRTSRLR